MRKTRYQIVTRSFQVAGVSLLLIDGLLYFLAYQHMQSELSHQLQQFASLRQSIFDSQARIERLTKSRAALPETGKKLASLVENHTAPRRQMYSQASKLVHLVAEQSGAQLDKVAFKEDTKSTGPLLRLAVFIDIQGSFQELLKFAHGLETAGELLEMRSFSLSEGKESPLELRLAADLYVTP